MSTSNNRRSLLVLRMNLLWATCAILPTIEIRPRPLPKAEGKRLLEKLPRYDWILFTSHHGVDGLVRLAGQIRKSLPRFIRATICAIGPRTAKSVRSAGLKVGLLPEQFSTEGLRRVFKGISVRNRRILIPRSNLGVRDALAQELRRRGAVVEEVVLYETVPAQLSPGKVRRSIRGLDAATFTSASTVHAFFQALQAVRPRSNGSALLNGAAMVAIGPATAQALKEHGVRRVHLPRGGWTVDGLVDAVVEAVR